MTFPEPILRRAAGVRLVSFDVDGVLTDGKLYYTSAGEEIKAFNVQDGSAIKLLLGHGVEVAIITGRDSPMVSRRAAELGIPHLFQNVDDKAQALDTLCERLALRPSEVAHVGDDLPDLALFAHVGLAIAVPSGHPAALARAHYVTQLAGGTGVAREVCELILRARGAWALD
ncbi:MAG: HAD-IIIA family hydrolase [Pseudomonadales bacterium]